MTAHQHVTELFEAAPWLADKYPSGFIKAPGCLNVTYRDIQVLSAEVDRLRERATMPTVNELTELMNILKNQTPSAPAWFPIIDQVVGTLLAIEIERAKNATE
jgi:hypothetical protein